MDDSPKLSLPSSRIRASRVSGESAPQSPDTKSLRWKVVIDPDGVFRDRLFSWEQIKYGGFDAGTVFEHIRTHERKLWNGINLVAEE